MQITVNMNQGTCTLLPQGRIDTLTSGEVDAAVMEHSAKCEKLVIDMSEVDYVSSAGIRVLVHAYQVMGKEHFTLKNVSKNVMQLLKMTGFDRVLDFE